MQVEKQDFEENFEPSVQSNTHLPHAWRTTRGHAVVICFARFVLFCFCSVRWSLFDDHLLELVVKNNKNSKKLRELLYFLFVLLLIVII